MMYFFLDSFPVNSMTSKAKSHGDRGSPEEEGSSENKPAVSGRHCTYTNVISTDRGILGAGA